MKKFSGALIAIVSFYFLVSCTETVAPVLTGSISGFISLHEEDGTPIKDRSGVRVSIEGRSNVAFTNTDGRYKLENVSAGIFNIIYEKEGFGLNKIIAREFVGGGDAFIYELLLSKLPSFNVTSLTINKISTQPPYLSMRGNLSDVRNYSRSVIIFFGKGEDVSNDPKNYLRTNSIYVYSDSSTFGYSWSDYNRYFLDAGFISGETVYVAAYSASDYYWGSVFDPVTGRYYFYNVGSSPVKSSFVLD